MVVAKMISAVKEIRCPVAVKRLLRRRNTSYAQARHCAVNFSCIHRTSRLPSRALLPFEEKQSNYGAHGFARTNFRPFFSSVKCSSSIEQDEENVGVGMDPLELEEISFEQSVYGDTVDDLAHLRIKLYPIYENDSISESLERLYEAASIQQIFDVVEENANSEDGPSLKIASQALVTVWDLQKLYFKISANFEPERDYFDRPSFVVKVVNHPTFQEKIVKPIVDNCELLEDEPLLANLLCLKRMNYDIRGAQCQKFIEECLRRSTTLTLPSISRLFVCMRTESLFGMLLCSKFFPLLSSYIDTMSSDIEVRLVSISLRNTLRIVSEAMTDKFRIKLSTLADDFPKWETVTLCKIFLFLMANRNVGSESKHVFDLVGEELIGRVPTMQLMDLLSIQKFLELGYLQPYGLVEALVSRMMRIVQEGVSSSITPRLDLLASIAPHLKTVQQRRQLAAVLQDYLENHNFEVACGILFGILRWARANNQDNRVYDLFWNKAAEMVLKKQNDNVLDRRILKLAREYINFTYGLHFGYKSKHFEHTAKRYIYNLIDNYMHGTQPCLLLPGDFSRSFSFLMGCAAISDPLFYDIEMVRILDDFSPQFRSSDLSVLSRGLESVVTNLFNSKRPSHKYYDTVLEISSIIDEQCSRILLNDPQSINFGDLLAINKAALVTRKVKGESPVVGSIMERLLQIEIDDARSMKDLAQHLIHGLNNFPAAIYKIEDFIWNLRDTSISPELIEKFVILAFCVGWETNNDRDIFGFCGDVLAKHWEKIGFLSILQSSMGLCFYRRLPRELVQNIFSVEFLDSLDDELATSHKTNQYSMKLRHVMMELNRAICIDMPDANLPWFHEKFCEELLSMYKYQETYLHTEVRKVLAEIVGDGDAVQANLCSPYYYYLDFVIEFDGKSRPIRKNRRQHMNFFQKFRKSPDSVAVGRKVAVLILSPLSFTKSVRSLRGHIKLRKRHLEILGYDVIEIDPMTWNSMYMSEKAMRHTFLESQLYAKASVNG